MVDGRISKGAVVCYFSKLTNITETYQNLTKLSEVKAKQKV